MRRGRHLAVGLAVTTVGGLVALAACAESGPEVAVPANGELLEQPIEVTPAPTTTVVVSAPRASMPSTTAARTTVATTVATTTIPPTTAPTTTAPTTTVPPSTAPPTTADPALVAVAPPLVPVAAIGRGGGGDAVRVLQARLLELGFWLNGVDGEYGPTTSQAVMAVQKYFGLPEKNGSVDQPTADLLNTVAFKPVGMARDGDLVEINLTKQVLHVVRGGETLWTLNTSTGSGLEYTEVNQKTGKPISGRSITPEGSWKVNRERPEGWWEGDLGEIYRPKYFKGGVAVHGAPKVPNFPASHGCVRVSVPAMDFIWAENLMPMGSPVWVHG